MHLAYNLIEPRDKVLDVGGWAQPFRRADAVIDFLAYEERQTANTFLLSLKEYFSKDTWYQHDICDHNFRFPFQDNEFDFVVCGHVLEDVRDPIYVVAEMQRVGKRGYIEVPSRFYEQLVGLELEKMCGASHHRWFIDLHLNEQTNENELIFVHKSHAVHFSSKFRLEKPKTSRFFPYLNVNFANLGLLWEGEFTAREDIRATITGDGDFMEETLRLGKQVGGRLWEQREGYPCEFSEYPFSEGIVSLWDLEDVIERRVLHYDPHRNRTREVMDYEREILSDDPNKLDVAGQVLPSSVFDSQRVMAKRGWLSRQLRPLLRFFVASLRRLNR